MGAAMYEYAITSLIAIDLALIAFAGKWAISVFAHHAARINDLEVAVAELRVRLDECNCE
jgi:hypothetical protein